MRIAEVQTKGRGFRISADVTLRECSVVIVGSTCRICGRAFKCESDVALHTRWRHNAALGSLMDILDHHKINLDGGQKFDVCDMPFEILSSLRIHKRLTHKHRLRQRRRRQKGMVRVKFKLNGVTTTDVSLDRRYIKLQDSLGYIVDVRTQTPGSFENEGAERKDNCAGNIDLSFPNHVVDESHMQHGIWPDKAANRYIVGKFASTKGDATASRTVVVGKSLAEISNTPHKGAIPDSNSSCERHEDRCYLASQETTADMVIKTFSDSIDIRDKENSPTTNERERRNCQNEISFDDNKVLLACQPEKSDKTSPMSKQNSWSSESPHYSIRWSGEVAGAKETAELTNSFINSMEIIINNGKSYGFDGDATKRLAPPLSRLHKKTESAKTNSNIDDDVQEVLRIMRGNTQNDINHESPNRMEREMLVQNAASNTLPSQLEPTIYPEECDVVFANFGPSDCPSFMTMTESEYQFLANSFDRKLGIYLEDVHHYGIKLCNNLPEINNNLEEYAVCAHQDIFETWKQSDGSPYTMELKANDNEVAVVLD
ncbi:uncharacterized protein [Temnothorax nylanderi]|uniref:uncharacterized protein n=1 Tax=Temnothorax nylanderi TaxID=102681 RepID=UPI003A8A1C47